MSYLKAVKFKNLDEALDVLRKSGLKEPGSLFDDGGEEPQGLLSIVSEDQVPEDVFLHLFDQGKGTLVEVEKRHYEGYGPPAEEQDYIGYVTKKTAYVVKGCGADTDITGCPDGAKDIHHLEAMILAGQHPVDRDQVARALGLQEDWDFDDLIDLVFAREFSAEEIDRLIHKGIH